MKKTLQALAFVFAFALPAIGFVACGDNEEPVVLSDQAEIVSVSINSEVIQIAPRLDEETTPVSYVFYVRHDVDPDDINALVPNITVSDKATLYPQSGKAADFSGYTGTVRYTVTAQDGSMQHYDIICKKLPSDEAFVMTVEIEEDDLVLTQPRFEPGDESATFVLKAGTTAEQRSSLTPIIRYMGESISPESGKTQDFTSGSVLYTVTAEDGTTTADFTLYCETDLYDGTEILEMEFDSDLIIEQPNFDGNNITFTVNSSATAELIAQLAPSVLTLSPGATSNYAVGEAPGFEDGVAVEYEITAENGDTDTYYVTCIRIKSDQAYVISVQISEVDIVETQPEMESGDNEATFYLKAGTTALQKASITPVFEYVGASISPESGAAQDFTSGSVVYMVYSEDGTKDFEFTLNCETLLFDGNEILEIAFDPEKVSDQPKIQGNNITFYVSDTASDGDIAALAPTVLTLSEGATSNYQAGQAPGFVDRVPVEYIVTAENGEINTYYVTCKRYIVHYYGFEDWTQTDNYWMEKQWWNANSGVATAINSGIGIPYPTDKTEDSYSGKYAAELKTHRAAKDITLMPGLVAGNMYLGGFHTTITDILASTKFGIPWYDKPIKVVGKFKYLPGDPANFWNNKTAAPGNNDSYAMTAVIYEVNDYGTYENGAYKTQGSGIFAKYLCGDVLTGKDLNGDIENHAWVRGLAQQSGTETIDTFTEFELVLDYKDFEISPDKKYKFAMIFSPSKNGADYKGADGSTLIIDDIYLYCE